MAQVRRLNPQGIERFREYLQALKENPGVAPPVGILDDPDYSDVLQDQVEIVKVEFKNRTHMVKYLSTALENLNTQLGAENQGLWSWLSLFYFDQVCPEDLSGCRKAGMDYRHILEKGYRHRHRHRHLLAGPYITYQMYREKARLLLHGLLHQENKIHHELAARQEFITNRSIIEATDTLYFDKDKNKPKAGILSKTRADSLLRFVDVIQQLELNYDLYSMEAQEIISLLPNEFNGSGTV